MIHSEPKIFQTQRQFARAVTELKRRCEVMALLHEQTGTPKKRNYECGFAGLSQIIVGQQLSIPSAAAIWRRVQKGVSPFTAEALLSLNETQLADFGLSKPKIRTLRGLADAVTNREIDFATLDSAPDEEVSRQLAALHGIGPWTADIYLLFALARRDAFPAGDLALQTAAGFAFKRPQRPSAHELLALAERWRPYRGAAAHILWASYADLKRTRQSQRSPVKPPSRQKKPTKVRKRLKI